MTEAENDETTPFEVRSKMTQKEPAVVHHVDDGSDRTVTSKESSRKLLDEEVKKFLSQGGAVTTVAPRVTADPPKKPVSNYGSRPI